MRDAVLDLEEGYVESKVSDIQNQITSLKQQLETAREVARAEFKEIINTPYRVQEVLVPLAIEALGKAILVKNWGKAKELSVFLDNNDLQKTEDIDTVLDEIVEEAITEEVIPFTDADDLPEIGNVNYS